jgi:hypothetical protein
LLGLGLGEHPGVVFAVQGDIDPAEAYGVHIAAALAGRKIRGGKDRADERDDRQRMAPVVAETVDIPPCVPPGRDR